MTSVLRTGFSEIREKGLVERPMAELFVAGLKNISYLDPRYRFNAADDLLELRDHEETLLTLPAPEADDLPGWIAATLSIYEKARTSSPIAVQTDREMLYQFMFDGALNQIDPYSRYSGNRNARANRAARNGAIGIGMDYEMRVGGAQISSIVRNGPAERAGLQVGDLISSVDGKPLAGLTRDTARRLFTGTADSVVRMQVFRPGFDSSMTVAARRGLVVPHTVDLSVTDNVAYLKVRSFNVHTSIEVSQAIAKAKEETKNELTGVVLDLRGDPGGLLDQAIDLSDLFLDSGSIVTLTGRHAGSKQYYAARPGDIADGKPMVILVDGKSASSSEITAAALADNGRALTIGTNTLGKGSVQTLIRLPNDGEIALTWAEVVSPAGYRVHGLGLLPTICTSDYAGPLASLMEHVYRREAPWRALPERWKTPERNPDTVGELRGLCPAQSRPEELIDQALAIRMATDRALYAQASAASLASSDK